MITFLSLIAFVWVVFSNRSLHSRLDALDLKIKNGVGVAPTNAPMGVPPEEFLKDASRYDTSNQAKLEEITQDHTVSVNRYASSVLADQTPNKVTTWLKEDWLMKLGAFLFIIGFGWFVSYAFANNWIGPVGRISLGILAGIVIMALGFKRMIKYPGQGAVFMGLGAGMAILTIFAGRVLYEFFTPATAVLFDFLIVAFVSFASYKFNIKSLAYLAQVLAFVTPLLVPGSTDSVFLFSYLFLISFATVILAGVTGWRDLIVSSIVFVGLYSLPYIGAGEYKSFGYSTNVYAQNGPIILNFAYVFSMMYLFTGMLAVIKKGVSDAKNEVMLAMLNGLFLFCWIAGVAPKEWHSVLFAVWAVIFAVSSFMAFRLSSKLAPFYAYGSVAVAFIAAATAAQLDGPTLVIAFTIEILFLVLSVLALTKNVKVAITTSWLFLVPGFLSLGNMSHYANSQNLFTQDFFALLVLAFSLILCGRIIVAASKHEQKTDDHNLGSALVVLGTLYLGYMLWHLIHIAMRGAPDIATMTTLVIYTVIGLIAYFAGLYGNDMARRTYGVVLLAFVVLRLLFIDVWDMALFGRVITFLAIGILLMSTAFLTKRKKHEMEIAQ